MLWDRVDKYSTIVMLVHLLMGRKKQTLFIHCRKMLGGPGHPSPPQAVLCSTRTLGPCCGCCPWRGRGRGPARGWRQWGRMTRPLPSRPSATGWAARDSYRSADRDPERHSLRSERPRVYLSVREKLSTRCHGLGTLRRMPPGQEPVLPQ